MSDPLRSPLWWVIYHQIAKHAGDQIEAMEIADKVEMAARSVFRITTIRPDTTARNADILRLRKLGWSFGQIAKHKGVSRSTVAGVVWKDQQR